MGLGRGGQQVVTGEKRETRDTTEQVENRRFRLSLSSGMEERLSGGKINSEGESEDVVSVKKKKKKQADISRRSGGRKSIDMLRCLMGERRC